METEINVAEILKDKPQGTKLYSSICGAVELKEVLDVRKKKSIVVKELNSNNQHRFWYDGKFFRTGQCVLQPSENMADWSKFAWKKGDILVSNDRGTEVIFDNGTMKLTQVSIVSITLTVKMRIKSCITKHSYVQPKDILLKIRIPSRPTSTPSRKDWAVNLMVRHWRLRSSLSSRMGI